MMLRKVFNLTLLLTVLVLFKPLQAEQLSTTAKINAQINLLEQEQKALAADIIAAQEAIKASNPIIQEKLAQAQVFTEEQIRKNHPDLFEKLTRFQLLSLGDALSSPDTKLESASSEGASEEVKDLSLDILQQAITVSNSSEVMEHYKKIDYEALELAAQQYPDIKEKILRQQQINQELEPLKKQRAELNIKAISKFKTIKTYTELKQILSQTDKPALLYFTAVWCFECNEWEKILEEEVIQEISNDFELLRADVTEGNKDDKELQEALEVIGPPMYLFFTSKDEELKELRQTGYIRSMDRLLGILKEVKLQNN